MSFFNIDPPPFPFGLVVAEGYKGSIKEAHSPIHLHFAINKNDIDEVKALILKNVDLDYMVFGQTPLAVSIFKESYDIACLLVESGAKLTKAEKSRWLRLPIHLAAHSGYVPLIDKILERCPESIHAKDAIMFTPLHWAAAMGHLPAVKLLIAHRSDVNAVDDRGKSPLHRAAENDKTKVVLFLLNNGANANLQDNLGWTPICQPIICQNLNLVKLFLTTGFIDLNLKDIYGKTLLHKACNPKSENNLWALCQANLDITTRHLKASTPALHKVLLTSLYPSTDHTDIVSLLLNYGADYNAKDNNGDTPLSIAATFGFFEIITLLLNAASEIPNENWISSKRWPENLVSHETFATILKIAHNGPYSLKKLCKSTIRKNVRVKIDDNIFHLPLPNHLLKYLLLSKLYIDE